MMVVMMLTTTVAATGLLLAMHATNAETVDGITELEKGG